MICKLLIFKYHTFSLIEDKTQPAKPINPDPTKPFTYQTKKHIISQNPDGSIRYDNGISPAVTVKKGETTKVERHEFFFR